jgi:hypothetical protein
MTSIVFVHGTGVRRQRYLETWTDLREGMRRHLPDVAVLPCAWGDLLGTPDLQDSRLLPGGSLPTDGGHLSEDEEAADAAARQTILEVDPLHEIWQLALRWGDRRAMSGHYTLRTPARVFDDVRAAMSGSGDLSLAVAKAGLSGTLRTAFDLVVDADPSRIVTARISVGRPEWTAFADCLTEAAIAQAVRLLPLSEPLPEADSRRQAARLLVDALQGLQLGVGDTITSATRYAATALGRTGGRLVMECGGNWALEHWRGSLSERSHPLVGDILRYLAFGGALRSFITHCVEQTPAPVILVGHSLGGIAALDTVALNPDLPIAALVTVGSQGSKLYRMHALPGLPDDAPLPDGFPPWVNVYSRHDLLSYLAGPVFGAAVRDVEVNGARSMPAAHSAYFRAKSPFYDVLAEVVRASAAGVRLPWS